MEAAMSTATEIKGPLVKELSKELGKEKESELRINAAVLPSEPRPVPRAAKPAQIELFRDVLLESSVFERRRSRLAATLSFVIQCLLVGILLIIPLMFTDALPREQLLTFLEAPPPPPPPPPAASAAAARVVRHIESDLLNGRLRAPSRIPQAVQMIREDEAPPDLSGGGVPGGVPGGIPGGQIGGVLGGILSSTPKVVAVPKLVTPMPPKRIRVSQGVTEGRLILKVEPKYPVSALAARVQGQVVLSAVISKTGEIQNLVLISGHPMLVPAAIAAVKQWRYRPYLLNGEPVEVETTVNVNFEIN
jgi:protein TonB